MEKTVKKRVSEEWLRAFSQLSAFSQNKFYKILGSCLIGIELIKSPLKENYSPYFVIYPLWKKDVKSNLNYPIILKEFKDKNGYQYDIPYEMSSVILSDVIKRVRQNCPLPFDSNIPLLSILSLMDTFSKEPPLSAAPNSYLQAVLQESKLKIALYGSIQKSQIIFNQIKKTNWDAHHFSACGVDLNNWLESLREELDNREDFLRQIEINKRDSKILKLKFSEIII